MRGERLGKGSADEPIVVLTEAELKRMAEGVELGENEGDSTRGNQRPLGLDRGEEGSGEVRGEGTKSDPSEPLEQGHQHVFVQREVLRQWRAPWGARHVHAWVCECGEVGYPAPEVSK